MASRVVETFMVRVIAVGRERARRAAMRERSSKLEGDRRPVRLPLRGSYPYAPPETAYWQSSDAPGGETDELTTSEDDEEGDARSAALVTEYVREQRANEAAGVPALDVYAIAERACDHEQRRLGEARLGADSGPHQYAVLEAKRNESPVWHRAFDVATTVVPDLMRARMSVTLKSPAQGDALVSMPMAEVMESRSELLNFLVYMCQVPAVRAGRLAAYVYDMLSAISRNVADLALMAVLESSEQHDAKLSTDDCLVMLRNTLSNYPPCHDQANLRIEFDFTSA